MSSSVRPYGQESKKTEVARMFDRIAGRYDFLNHFLSLGIDHLWRRQAVNCLREDNPQQILDVATGTADLALAALRLQPQKIVGVDISRQMLAVGRQKIKRRGLDSRIELLEGDSEALPFVEGSFDAALCAYGVRNFEDLQAGLCEIRRVLRPGSLFVVLEFSKPSVFPIKQLFGLYFRKILPSLGRWLSSDARAYSYLHESVAAFPEGEAFARELQQAGFKNPTWKPLTFGITSLYTARA
jgi:demethylmenaquinone methyltransferase/2-methoxy-6-polyprenyl-1,4-benzoquinol methylase